MHFPELEKLEQFENKRHLSSMGNGVILLLPACMIQTTKYGRMPFFALFATLPSLSALTVEIPVMVNFPNPHRVRFSMKIVLAFLKLLNF